jgi:uncharacterized protein (DUF433 family)
MTTSLGVSKEHITKTPGVCGGRACIAGHRIRVMDVVLYHEHMGRTPAEIVEMFPGITLADVHAALAYYHDNLAEIEHDFEVHRQPGRRVRQDAAFPAEGSARQTPRIAGQVPRVGGEVW